MGVPCHEVLDQLHELNRALILGRWSHPTTDWHQASCNLPASYCSHRVSPVTETKLESHRAQLHEERVTETS